MNKLKVQATRLALLGFLTVSPMAFANHGYGELAIALYTVIIVSSFTVLNLILTAILNSKRKYQKSNNRIAHTLLAMPIPLIGALMTMNSNDKALQDLFVWNMLALVFCFIPMALGRERAASS